MQTSTPQQNLPVDIKVGRTSLRTFLDAKLGPEGAQEDSAVAWPGDSNGNSILPNSYGKPSEAVVDIDLMENIAALKRENDNLRAFVEAQDLASLRKDNEELRQKVDELAKSGEDEAVVDVKPEHIHETGCKRYFKQFLFLADRYGATAAPGPAYAVSMGPKTCVGATVSLLFAAIVIILVFVQVYNFFDPNNFTMGLGDGVIINADPDPPDWPGKVGSSGADAKYAELLATNNAPQMNLPTLLVDFTVQIQFYEDYAPGSLQSLEIIDNTGYEPYFTSSSKLVPQSMSVVQRVAVPFDSFDDNLQTVDSPREPVRYDLRDLLSVQSTQSTLSEPLKAVYALADIFGSVNQFFSHDVHLFVRLKASQLKKMKSGQLQIYLYNKGIASLLTPHSEADANLLVDVDYQTSEYFPGLATSDVTYAKNNFPHIKNKGFRWMYTLSQKERAAANIGFWPGTDGTMKKLQVVHIRSSLDESTRNSFLSSEAWGPRMVNITQRYLAAKSQKLVSPADFNSWIFGINYVNNFIHTYPNYQCDFHSGNNWYEQEYATLSTNNGIIMYHSAFVDEDGNPYELYPEAGAAAFFALASTVWGTERGKFQKSNNGMSISRLDTPSKIMYNSSSGDIKALPTWYVTAFEPCCDIEDFFPGRSMCCPSVLQYAPVEWSCDLELYANGDGICDCRCGAWDPDCGLFGLGNSPKQINNCGSGEFCSLSGTCMVVDPFWLVDEVGGTPLVALSSPCTYLAIPGEVKSRGFVGTAQEFDALKNDIGSCPGDTVYGQKAQQDDTGQWLCSYAARGQINLIKNRNRDPSFSLADVRGPIYMNVTVFVGVGSPFPVSNSSHPTLKVAVNPESGNRENLLAHVGPLNKYGEQQMLLARAKGNNFLKPLKSHLGYGTVMHAIDQSTRKVIVLNDVSGIPYAHNFDIAGPYPVLVSPIMKYLQVIRATKRNSGTVPYQVLTLAEPPDFSLGISTFLHNATKPGDLELAIRYADMKRVAAEMPAGVTEVPAVIMRGDVFELISVTNVGPGINGAVWECPRSSYAGYDGCDCGCGMWDPDCIDPSQSGQTRAIYCHVNDDFETYDLPTDFCLFDTSATETHDGYFFKTVCERGVSDISTWPFDATTLQSLEKQSVDLFTETLVLSGQHPLINSYSPGDRVLVGADLRFLGTVFDATGVANVVMSRADAPYSPSLRYKPTPNETTESPDVLDATLAVYTTPHRDSFRGKVPSAVGGARRLGNATKAENGEENDFSEHHADQTFDEAERRRLAGSSFNLCPVTSQAKTLPKQWTNYNYDKWEIQESRKMKVTCPIISQTYNNTQCKSRDAYVLAFNDSYRKACLDWMPPTYSFSYKTTQYWNNKWKNRNAITPDEAPINGLRLPELTLDVSHVYHFTHSKDDDLVETSFSEGRLANGDEDQFGVKHYYFGSPYYRGDSKRGSDSWNYGMPAETAFLKASMQIKPSPSALEDALKIRAHAWFWADGSQLNSRQLQKFPTINIEFDVSTVGGSNGQILLEPGFSYLFQANVAIWPVINQPKFLPNILEWIDRFGYDASDNSITKTRLGYFSKHKAIVQMQVNFVQNPVQIKTPNLVFSDFVPNIAAAFGYFGMGIFVLFVIQYVFCQVRTNHEWALSRLTTMLSPAK